MPTPLVLDQSAGGKDGFVHVYGVELLCEQKPLLDKAALLAALRGGCGDVEPMGSGTSPLLFAHSAHPAIYNDGVVPAQTLIDIRPAGSVTAEVEQALQQSWDWPDARAAIARCEWSVLVTDFMATALPYKERLALFRTVVTALLGVVPCAAIHWRPSQRVVDPADYLRKSTGEQADPTFPAINVRLFNIANREEGDTVMDTLGLAALGVPDLQCHFRDLNLTEVAGVLYNSADYLFENGDVIEDGHTIQGLTAAQRWRCRHEDAIVDPARVVLDLDPGPPHGAGNRTGRDNR